MASNLSSLLLGGVMSPMGTTPPDKNKKVPSTPAPVPAPTVAPAPVIGGATTPPKSDTDQIVDLFKSFTHFGQTPAPPKTPERQVVTSQLDSPIDEKILTGGLKESSPFAKRVMARLKEGMPMSTAMQDITGTEITDTTKLSPLEVLSRKGVKITNPKLKDAFHDAVELYTRAIGTDIGVNGFRTPEDKADAIKSAARLATKISNTKNEANLIDFGIEHDEIKRSLHQGRQGWRVGAEGYTATPSEGAKQTREFNSDVKRKAVGTLVKSFFDRKYKDVSGIATDPKRTGAVAHKELMEIQGYVGKNPSDATLDDFMASPIGRNLIESIGDNLDTVGAWDTEPGKAFLQRISVNTTDSKELDSRLARARQTVLEMGAEAPDEPEDVKTRRSQYAIAMRNAEDDLAIKQRGLTDQDTADFGGLFNVGQYVDRALTPSGLPSKLDTRATPATRGAYVARTNKWAKGMQGLVKALRDSGGDVNSDAVRAAAEQAGEFATSKFLGAYLGASSKTPVPYIGEYGQHTFDTSVTPEGQLSEASLAQTQGKTSTRQTGYGQFKTRAAYTGTLLAGLNLSDGDLNNLASEAGFKLPNDVAAFKEAARMSAGAANVNGALTKLGDLTKVYDLDADGNPMPLSTGAKNTATLSGVVLNSVTRMLDKLSELNGQTAYAASDLNDRSGIAKRVGALNDYVGSAIAQKRETGTQGSQFKSTWHPFAIGSNGEPNYWSPTTTVPSKEGRIYQVGSIFGFAAEDAQYRDDVNKHLKNIQGVASGSDMVLKDQVSSDINMAAAQFRSQFSQAARHMYDLADQDPEFADRLKALGVTTLDEADKSKFVSELAGIAQKGPGVLRQLSSMLTGYAPSQKKTIGVAPVRNQRDVKAGEAQKVVNVDTRSQIFDPIEKVITRIVDESKGVDWSTLDKNQKESYTKKQKEAVYAISTSVESKLRQLYTTASTGGVGTVPDALTLPSDDAAILAARDRITDYAEAKLASSMDPTNEQLRADAQAKLTLALKTDGLVVKSKSKPVVGTGRLSEEAALSTGRNLLSSRGVTPSFGGETWDNLNKNKFDRLASAIGSGSAKIMGLRESRDLDSINKQIAVLTTKPNKTEGDADKLVELQDKADTLKSFLSTNGEGELIRKQKGLQSKLDNLLANATPANKREIEKVKQQLDSVKKEIGTTLVRVDGLVKEAQKLTDATVPHSAGGAMTKADYDANKDVITSIDLSRWSTLSPEQKKRVYDDVQAKWKAGGTITLPIKVMDYGPQDIKFSDSKYEGSKHALATGFTPHIIGEGEKAVKHAPEVPPMHDENGKRNPNVRIRQAKDSDGNRVYFIEHIQKGSKDRVIARQEVYFEAPPEPQDKTSAEWKAWKRKSDEYEAVTGRREIATTRLAMMNKIEAERIKPATAKFAQDLPEHAQKVKSIMAKLKPLEDKVFDVKSKNATDNQQAFTDWAKLNGYDLSNPEDNNKAISKFPLTKNSDAEKAVKALVRKMGPIVDERTKFLTSIGLVDKDYGATSKVLLDIADNKTDAKTGAGKLIAAFVSNQKQVEYSKALPELFKTDNKEPRHWNAVISELKQNRANASALPMQMVSERGEELFWRGQPQVAFTRGGFKQFGGLSFDEFDKRVGEKVSERNKEYVKGVTAFGSWVNRQRYQMPDGTVLRVNANKPFDDIWKAVDAYGPKVLNVFRDAQREGASIAGLGAQYDAGTGPRPEDRDALISLAKRDEAALEAKRRNEVYVDTPANKTLRAGQAANRTADAAVKTANNNVGVATKPLKPSAFYQIPPSDKVVSEISTIGFTTPNGKFMRYDSPEYGSLIESIKKAHAEKTKPSDASWKLFTESIKQQTVPYERETVLKSSGSGSKNVVFIPPTQDDPGGIFKIDSDYIKSLESKNPDKLKGAFLVQPGGMRIALDVIHATSPQRAGLIRIPSLTELGISSKHPLAKYAGQIIQDDGSVHKEIKALAVGKAKTSNGRQTGLAPNEHNVRIANSMITNARPHVDDDAVQGPPKPKKAGPKIVQRTLLMTLLANVVAGSKSLWKSWTED